METHVTFDLSELYPIPWNQGAKCYIRLIDGHPRNIRVVLVFSVPLHINSSACIVTTRAHFHTSDGIILHVSCTRNVFG